MRSLSARLVPWFLALTLPLAIACGDDDGDDGSDDDPAPTDSARIRVVHAGAVIVDAPEVVRVLARLREFNKARAPLTLQDWA